MLALTWLGLLAIAVVLVAVVARTGARPKGGRPVGGTQLMTARHIVVLVVAPMLAYVVFTR